MRVLAGAFLVLITALRPAPAQHPPEGKLTGAKLTYGVEWRLIRAGTVTLEFHKAHATMKLESAGIVSSLVKILDAYDVDYQDGPTESPRTTRNGLTPTGLPGLNGGWPDPLPATAAVRYCATSSVMDSKEGKRHHETRVTYDYARRRAFFVERDLIKDATLKETGVDIPACTSDVVGALLALRGLNLAPGQSTQLPVSDGRKFAQVRIEAQEREQIKTAAGSFSTIRYEADLLNGVVYPRKGHVHLWLTDDARRLPVQIRARLNFPVGAVTLQLEKEEQP